MCPSLGVATDERHEDWHEREREEHDARRDEVDRGDETEDPTGTTRARRAAARAGERRLERIDASYRNCGDLGAPGAVESGRPVAEPPLDEVEPQLREHARRRPPPGDLEAPGCCSPSRRGDEQHERQHEVCERDAAEGPSRHVGEERRLGENEERREDAERGVGAEQTCDGRRSAQ